MSDGKVLYACSEHVEIAIDDIVNLEEQAPEIIKFTEEKCSYCENQSEYKVSSV